MRRNSDLEAWVALSSVTIGYGIVREICISRLDHASGDCMTVRLQSIVELWL